MTTNLRITGTLHFTRGRSGQKKIETGPPPEPVAPCGRVPRLTRLMALAIRFDGLIRAGVVADQADLAELGHVSRARITQIMNLLQLAPDIQEEILFLPLVASGRDPVRENDIRPITAVFDWRKQRKLWRDYLAQTVELPDTKSM